MLAIATLSVATGEEYETAIDKLEPVGVMDLLAGQVMVGGIMSVTVTGKEQVDCRNALSTAVHTTFVTEAPANWLGEGGSHAMLLMPELSVAVAVYVTVAYDLRASGALVTGAGHVMLGRMESCTTTEKKQVVVKL